MRPLHPHAILVLASLILAVPAIAAEGEEQETGFSIVPRVWFAVIDLSDDERVSTEAWSMPLYGLSLTLNPGGAPNWGFVLTALTGDGDADNLTTWNGARGTSTHDRTDIELLVRRSFPGSGLSLFFGPRFVTFDSDASTAGYETSTETELGLFELGLGHVTEVSESGKHRFFSNLIFGVADTEFEWESNEVAELPESGTGTEVTLDLSLGYQYAFGAHGSLVLRYRVFMIAEDNDHDQSSYTSLQGPELGLSFRF